MDGASLGSYLSKNGKKDSKLQKNCKLGNKNQRVVLSMFECSKWGKLDGVKNSVWLLIYSIVRKRNKDNPVQVNGGYSYTGVCGFFLQFKFATFLLASLTGG